MQIDPNVDPNASAGAAEGAGRPMRRWRLHRLVSHPTGDTEHPVAALVEVLADHHGQQPARLLSRRVQVLPVQEARQARASLAQPSISVSRAERSSQPLHDAVESNARLRPTNPASLATPSANAKIRSGFFDAPNRSRMSTGTV